MADEKKVVVQPVVQQQPAAPDPQPEPTLKAQRGKKKSMRSETIEGGFFVHDAQYDDEGELTYARIVNANGELLKEVESEQEIEDLKKSANGKRIPPAKPEPQEQPAPAPQEAPAPAPPPPPRR